MINFILKLVIFYSITILQANADFRFSTWTQAPLSRLDKKGYLDKVLIEGFRRADKNITIVHQSAERSIRNANSGLTDGEFIRVKGLDKTYTNLVQVPQKILDFEFVVFTKNRNIKIKDWDSLKPYRVGIVIGWKILEKNVKNTKTLERTTSKESLFKLLDKNRIDVAVYSRFIGLKIIEQMGLKNIITIEPPLATKPMYLYLNKKHQKFVPKISSIFTQMIEDGTFFKIRNSKLH